MMKCLLIAALLSVAPMAVGCGSREAGAQQPQVTAESLAPAPKGAGGPSTVESIAALCSKADEISGQTVRIRGVFQGFRVEGCAFPECMASASLTRSDWLLRTGGACGYVTGGVPEGIDPMDPAFAGRPVELDARVSMEGDGKLRLIHLSGRLLED